jgi:hypothetical protein
MRLGFLKTVRSVYEPFVEEDVERLGHLANRVLQMKWYFLFTEIIQTSKVEQVFIGGNPYFLTYDGWKMEAYSGICPFCSSLLFYSNLSATGKCFKCEETFHLDRTNGELLLEEYPIKKTENGYYLGIRE